MRNDKSKFYAIIMSLLLCSTLYSYHSFIFNTAILLVNATEMKPTGEPYIIEDDHSIVMGNDHIELTIDKNIYIEDVAKAIPVPLNTIENANNI